MSYSQRRPRSTFPSKESTRKSGPPSYAFADAQRGERDSVADDRKKVKKEIEEHEEDKKEDEVDKDSVETPDTKGRAPPATKATKQPEAKSVFAKVWTSVEDEDLPIRNEAEKSSWTPLSIKMFQILFYMNLILNSNEELKWICPHYFSLPVVYYYSVLFLVQILRAKEQAGVLTKSEGSWLRAFFRRYKDTQLPIAGPLVPLFSNITSVLPQSSLYDYVYPTIPYDKIFATNATGAVTKITHGLFSLPVPIFTLCQLLKFILTKDVSALVDPDDEDSGKKYFTESGFYRTAALDSDECVLAGIDIKSLAAGNKAYVLNSPSLIFPIHEDEDQLNKVAGYWKRSKLGALARTNLPTTTGSLLSKHARDVKSIQELTGISEDFEFFQDAVDMALVQVRFFSDSTTLSSIPTVGGPSTLVDVRLFPRNLPDSAANRTLPTDTGSYATTEWYPDTWMKFGYIARCYEAKLGLDDILTASYALTNGTINWSISNFATNGFSGEMRTGPYWVHTYTPFRATAETSVPQKPTFEKENRSLISGGVETMLRTQFYVYDGSA